MVAFDLNRFQLLFFDLDVLSLFQLVAAGFLVLVDDLAGLGIHHLLLQPVAGLFVDHVKSGFFDRGRGRIEHDGACDERKLQRPFPIGARGHYNLRACQVPELQPALEVSVPGAVI